MRARRGGGAGKKWLTDKCLAEGVQAQSCGGESACMLCPCLRVRVSFSVCASLQQMQPPSPTDHLTPAAAPDSSLCVWGGT